MQGFDQNTPERITPQKRSELCYGIRCCTCNMLACIQMMMDKYEEQAPAGARLLRVLRDAKAATEGVARLLRDAELEVEERESLLNTGANFDQPKSITPQRRSEICQEIQRYIGAVPSHIESGDLETALQLTERVNDGLQFLLRSARVDAVGTPDYKPTCDT